jgi:hypothetical protein
MTGASTPEQKQAWNESVEKTRPILNMINSGVAIGFGDIGGKPGYMFGFRVSDAATFQSAWQSMMETFSKAGMYSDMQIVRTADSLTTTLTPDSKRMMRLASAFGQDLTQEQIDAIDKSTKPVTSVMNFKGNNVTMVVTPDMSLDAIKFVVPKGMDIRGQIKANAWGNTDWFATLDLRVITGLMASAETKGFTLPEGPASMLSIRQGVQGGTQRISISTDMKMLTTLMEQYEKETMRVRMDARKTSAANKGADDKDEDSAAPDASMPGAP